MGKCYFEVMMGLPDLLFDRHTDTYPTLNVASN